MELKQTQGFHTGHQNGGAQALTSSDVMSMIPDDKYAAYILYPFVHMQATATGKERIAGADLRFIAPCQHKSTMNLIELVSFLYLRL